MAIPQFTEFGILPAGVHDCSLQEAEAFLATSEPRTEIWQGFAGFLRWAGELPNPNAILLDGSYVTDKVAPNDVDVVVDLTGCAIADMRAWTDKWAAEHDYVKDAFSVDFYPTVAGTGHDFTAFFQYVRIDEALRRGMSPDLRKGILRLAL
jgi:hypothetical protein